MNKQKIATVETFLDDELEMTRTIDLSAREMREWLRKHMLWAMMNDREVHAFPAQREASHE